MGQIALQIPQAGQPNSTEDVKVASNFTTVQTWANGNVDSANLSPAVLALLPASVVTSLPGSPTDGQVVYLLADATNGVVWQLRYRFASSSAFKWEFIGGPPLYAEIQTSESTSSAGYGDLATTGPSLTLPTLPNGGDFDVRVGALLGAAGGAGDSAVAYAIGGTGASDADAARITGGSSGTNLQASVVRTRRKTGLASAAAVVAKYRSQGVNTVAFSNRFLSITPVRIG